MRNCIMSTLYQRGDRSKENEIDRHVERMGEREVNFVM